MTMMSIGRIFNWHATQMPSRPAVTGDGRTLSWLELDARTNRLARAYQRLGVRPDDLVTIALPNGIEFFEAAIATWKLGAIPQPVSHRLPQIERAAIVELANAKLVVGALAGSRTSVPANFLPDQNYSDVPLPDRIATHWKAPTSGGSTGRPKLILSGFPGQFDPGASVYRMLPNRTHLVPGPLYHNAPFSLSCRALMLGNHVVVMPKFDALETLQNLAHFKIDYVLLVPTMMHRIWRLDPAVRKGFDLSALRIMVGTNST